MLKVGPRAILSSSALSNFFLGKLRQVVMAHTPQLADLVSLEADARLVLDEMGSLGLSSAGSRGPERFHLFSCWRSSHKNKKLKAQLAALMPRLEQTPAETKIWLDQQRDLKAESFQSGLNIQHELKVYQTNRNVLFTMTPHQ